MDQYKSILKYYIVSLIILTALLMMTPIGVLYVFVNHLVIVAFLFYERGRFKKALEHMTYPVMKYKEKGRNFERHLRLLLKSVHLEASDEAVITLYLKNNIAIILLGFANFVTLFVYTQFI